MSDEMLKRDVDELRTDIYGNGKKGLKYEVISLKVWMKINTAILMLILGATLRVLFKG